MILIQTKMKRDKILQAIVLGSEKRVRESEKKIKELKELRDKIL